MKPFQMDSQALVALAHDAVALTLSWAFAFALLRAHGAPAETRSLAQRALARLR